MSFIETIEAAVGRPARKNMLPMQNGDVLATYADTENLQQAVGFSPRTSIKEGVSNFVAWYQTYYGNRKN
jgi:UDP-glucuronate 4-epimerase